jgi:hypothetical protein
MATWLAVTNVSHFVGLDTTDGITAYLFVKDKSVRLSSAQCTALATALTTAAAAVTGTNTNPNVDPP